MLFGGIYFIVKLLFLQLYPAYICYKAIKVNDPNQFGPLLTYWVVASGFLVAEYLTDIFLFWVPFYTDIKFVLLLWLILPQTQGTLVVYRDWLDPFLSQHEEYIDKTLIDIQTKARQTISLHLQTLLYTLRNVIIDIIKGKHENTQDTQPPTAAVSNTPDKEEVSNTMNPFSLFSTFVGNQRPVTADKDIAASLVSTGLGPGTGAGVLAEETKVERTDSYDSLASFVSGGRNKTAQGKGGSSPSSSSSPGKDIDKPNETTATWGGYFTGWAWKASDAKKNNDIQESSSSPSSLKSSKTD